MLAHFRFDWMRLTGVLAHFRFDWMRGGVLRKMGLRSRLYTDRETGEVFVFGIGVSRLVVVGCAVTTLTPRPPLPPAGEVGIAEEFRMRVRGSLWGRR